jgi:large subunit ribosomal protein L13
MLGWRVLAAHQARAMKLGGANKYGQNKRARDKTHIERAWLLLDGRGSAMGRLASKIVPLLTGKHKPVSQTCRDAGDYVIVVNSAHVVLTGRGIDTKAYHYHSAFAGGLNTSPVWRLFEQSPVEPLRRAVFGMLPKNQLRHQRMSRLRLYPGPEHAHAATVNCPTRLAFRGEVPKADCAVRLERIDEVRETP